MFEAKLVSFCYILSENRSHFSCFIKPFLFYASGLLPGVGDKGEVSLSLFSSRIGL